MNDFLFRFAEILSRPPGFYGMLVLMAAGTLLVPFGYTGIVTYVLSVLAILITGVVLIQDYRDTAAIHAKLDEIILAMRTTRNDVVGLEKASPEEIEEALKRIESEAAQGAPRSEP